jgi:tRNA pseudouridine38-40 synthase
VPRYKLTIAYDGTDFCGWQKQEPLASSDAATERRSDEAGGDEAGSLGGREPILDLKHERYESDRPGRVALRTVQHVVERAVREVVREPIQLLGASRTDAGVHARGQIGAFTATDDPEKIALGSGWPIERGVDRLVRAVNGKLPEDVLVVGGEVVPAEFDPISWCTAKGYSYLLHVGMVRPLFDRRYIQQIWEALDVARMQEAAAKLIGEHDFAAFAAAGHGRLSTVRTVFDCAVQELDPTPQGRRIRIDISGSGFLWNMVRIVAGTLVEVGKGKMTAADVAAALESKDRRQAGPTLSPQGLCLEWVRYGDAIASARAGEYSS